MTTLTIEPFGQIKFNRSDQKWFGRVSHISPKGKVDLSIVVKNENQNLDNKIELIRNFSKDYSIIMEMLYELVKLKFMETQWEKSKEEIMEMYFLEAVELKEDDRTWWIVLEPNVNVSSVYNYFLRFTMVDRAIIWMN